MATRKIFLAEDSSGDAFLFEHALKAAGCEFVLTVASDGAAAVMELADAKPGQFDLVVLDLNLPKQNGEAVLSALRQTKLAGQLPVVILTSSDSDGERAATKSLGADHYFVKPLHLAGFYQIGRDIAKILNG